MIDTFDRNHVLNALRSGIEVSCGIHNEPTEIMVYLDDLELRGVAKVEVKNGRKHATWNKAGETET